MLKHLLTTFEYTGRMISRQGIEDKVSAGKELANKWQILRYPGTEEHP